MNTFHSEGRQLLFEAKHAHLDALSHVILLLRGTDCWRCPLWVQATNCFPVQQCTRLPLVSPQVSLENFRKVCRHPRGQLYRFRVLTKQTVSVTHRGNHQTLYNWRIKKPKVNFSFHLFKQYIEKNLLP